MRQILHNPKSIHSRPVAKVNRELLSAQIRVVLRAPSDAAVKRESALGDDLIAPIERGLAVLASFHIGDEWLGNQEIATRTSIPKATVTRLTQTLAAEGFLHHSERLRKYRLAPAVLGLGFAMIDNAEIATVARPHMQKLADECGVFVSLAGRDGLDVVLIENCHSASNPMTLALNAGARMPITSSPVGLALLSGLPKVERNYLLDRIRLRYEPDYRITLRKKVADAVTHVSRTGYCVSTGDWGEELVVAAAPLNVANRPPLVIACAGQAKTVTKAKICQIVGPRMVDLVTTLQACSNQSRDWERNNA